MRVLALCAALAWGAACAAPTALRFDQFYSGAGVRGPVFTPLAQGLNGQAVSLEGYVAPGEEGEAPAVLILSARPLRECPYCLEAADWPNDVEGMWKHVLVELPAGMAIPTPGLKVRVTGTLLLGNRPAPLANLATPLHLRATSVVPVR